MRPHNHRSDVTSCLNTFHSLLFQGRGTEAPTLEIYNPQLSDIKSTTCCSSHTGKYSNGSVIKSTEDSPNKANLLLYNNQKQKLLVLSASAIFLCQRKRQRGNERHLLWTSPQKGHLCSENTKRSQFGQWGFFLANHLSNETAVCGSRSVHLAHTTTSPHVTVYHTNWSLKQSQTLTFTCHISPSLDCTQHGK